jgi:aspartyl-tRNA(Asn)/glutamyl-tRNA(Gln) amidotransferase subunit C
MPVTREEVLAVARLARLVLEAGELNRMTGELNGILAHVGELRDVPIDGVPAFMVGGAGDPLVRSDLAGADPMHREPATIAPAWSEGFFTVPRVAAHGGIDEAGA